MVAATPVSAAVQKRFALIVGNDQGGEGTRPLRYATEDARKMHAVLTQIGGVEPNDITLNINQSASEFWRSMVHIETRIAESKQRGEHTVFIFYYSGHAKNDLLRLDETTIQLEEIKARLSSGQADIRIGIVDSCHSGIVNRTKGARRAPAFEIEATTGSEGNSGLVLLTSASADEEAQESDEIGGSYFSHYLVNGLRGDADRSRDRRVTLSEAYAYAYARTVADTAESAAGTQHPTFSYDLKGNSDLILTDITSRREGVLVPGEAPSGIYFFVDASGFIAAEVQKPKDQDRQIALPAGRYHVRRRLADQLRVGKIHITNGQLITLDEKSLKDAPFSDDPVKGARYDRSAQISLGLAGMIQSFFDRPTRDSLFPSTGLLGIDLEIRNFFRYGWLWGFDIASGGTRAKLNRFGTILPYNFSELTIGTTIAAEWQFLKNDLAIFTGPRMAIILMRRTFDEPTIPNQFFATFSPGIVVGLRYRISNRLTLLGRNRIHYLLYNVEENRSLGYWELAAGVSYDF